MSAHHSHRVWDFSPSLRETVLRRRGLHGPSLGPWNHHSTSWVSAGEIAGLESSVLLGVVRVIQQCGSTCWTRLPFYHGIIPHCQGRGEGAGIPFVTLRLWLVLLHKRQFNQRKTEQIHFLNILLHTGAFRSEDPETQEKLSCVYLLPAGLGLKHRPLVPAKSCTTELHHQHFTGFIL